MAKNDDFPRALKPLRFHGVFERSGPYSWSNDDLLGECPFCGREIAANAETGQWVCHSKPNVCGRSGNVPSFLESFVENAAETTTKRQWASLSARRGGIPARVFRRWGLGFDDGSGRWLIPVLNAGGGLQDVRVWTKAGKLMGTAGRPAGLWNWAGLDDAKPGVHVFICEGEWDGMSLDWLLRLTRAKSFVVVSIPGARTFKDDWADAIIGKEPAAVTVCPDNDGDGDRMAEKVWQRLQAKVSQIDFLNWPDSFPDKCDVRDFIVENHVDGGKSAKSTRRGLEKLISDEYRTMPFDGQVDAEVAAGKRERERVKRPKSNPSFSTTLDVYRRFLKMTTEHCLALQFCYAVYLATQWDDDPVWGFLCGVPGCGKTELLSSMKHAPEAVYYSNLESKQLVSGFRVEPDPSMIPEMIGNCAIFKDWTEILDGTEIEQRETYKTFRGAFDGEVYKPFGNGVRRHYVGRFNILAGVTNVIHSRNDASVGERFLKFQMPRPPKRDRDKVVWSAMLGATKEREKSLRLQEAAEAFLNRDVPQFDPAKVIPTRYFKRIAALAAMVSELRSKVEWKGYGFDKEVSHRNEPEMPTRLAKQLVKLAMANMVVLGKRKVERETFRLVERVAFNTAHGFHLDIIAAMMRDGGRNQLAEEIEYSAKIPRSTLENRLKDLEISGLIKRFSKKATRGPGRPGRFYSVVPSLRKLWDSAEPESDHIAEAINCRRKKGGWD